MAATALIRVLQRQAKQALRRRQLAEAEAVLERLKEEDALSAETRGLELELLIGTRRWDDAERLPDQLLRHFPASARIHYLAGRLCYQRKRYAHALEHFTEADRLHPHWIAQQWIGTTHIQRGEYAAAEAVLVALVADHPALRRDLAWLYERRGEPERALHEIAAYLALRPGDRVAQRQQLRLRASAAAPEVLVGEVAALEALGEAIAPEMLVPYVQRLLESGQGRAARQYIAEHAPAWPPELAGRVAWVCHRLQAYDVALHLFLQGLPAYHDNFKYCSALEATARRCERVNDVADAYHALARTHPHLHGRAKALGRRRDRNRA